MLDITNELLKLLACPVSQGKLIYDSLSKELICIDSGLAYPVKDGVPLLLVEQSRKLTSEEINSYKKAKTYDLEVEEFVS